MCMENKPCRHQKEECREMKSFNKLFHSVICLKLENVELCQQFFPGIPVSSHRPKT